MPVCVHACMLTPLLCQAGRTALALARGKPEMEGLLRQHEAEREAEKEVRRLTLLSTGRDAAGQVPIGEWEAMTWVERLARLKSAAPSEGSF